MGLGRKRQGAVSDSPSSWFSWSFAVKTGISLGCLGWVLWGLRGIDWTGSLAGLRDARWELVTASLGMVLLLYLSRLLRLRFWVECLAPVHLSWFHWLDLYLKSIALGAFTPSRVGEFSRVFLLEPSGLPFGKRVRLALLDRFSDLLYVPLALFLTVSVIEEVFGIRWAWSLLGGLFLVTGFLGVSLWFKTSLKGLVLWRGWVATVVGFSAFVLSNVLLFRALGIVLSWQEVLAVTVTTGVLAALPLSVAGIGIREGSMLAILDYWGVPHEQIPPVLVLELFVNILFPLFLLFLWRWANGGPRMRR